MITPMAFSGAFKFTFTAGTGGGRVGYISAAAAAAYGYTAIGSAAGPDDAPGGVIAGVYTSGTINYLIVQGTKGTNSATNISIDGAGYGLSLLTSVGGFPQYSFNSGTAMFSDGVKYGVVVT